MRRIFKWTGIVLGSFAGLVLVGLAIVYAVSERHFNRKYDVQPGAVAVRGDAQTIARGKHIALTRGCTDCHGDNLGGKTFIDAPPMARLFASNLTAGKGGVGRAYRDADWVRAIRHGVGPRGNPLLFMPSHEFNALSDEDAGALVAYLKTMPPVDNSLPANSVGPVGRVLYLTGQVPLVPAELIQHDRRPRSAPPVGPTAAYGKYLAAGCTGCHGTGFTGGKIAGPPGIPEAANLTMHPTGLARWTEQDFIRALREGKRPDGSKVDDFMPWRTTARMTDDELRALWAYLRTVPPGVKGNH
ncbi:MAG TPA: cytochrome c [Longimicrobium sp.]|jgi:cytochrome c553/mono/diheme cytochrome c family protein